MVLWKNKHNRPQCPSSKLTEQHTLFAKQRLACKKALQKKRIQREIIWTSCLSTKPSPQVKPKKNIRIKTKHTHTLDTIKPLKNTTQDNKDDYAPLEITNKMLQELKKIHPICSAVVTMESVVCHWQNVWLVLKKNHDTQSQWVIPKQHQFLFIIYGIRFSIRLIRTIIASANQSFSVGVNKWIEACRSQWPSLANHALWFFRGILTHCVLTALPVTSAITTTSCYMISFIILLVNQHRESHQLINKARMRPSVNHPSRIRDHQRIGISTLQRHHRRLRILSGFQLSASVVTLMATVLLVSGLISPLTQLILASSMITASFIIRVIGLTEKSKQQSLSLSSLDNTAT